VSPDRSHSGSYLRGEIFLHRGDLHGARRCFEEALTEEQPDGDPQRVIAILMNLGSVHAGLGEKAQARARYQEVLALQREAPDRRTIGQTLVNLGNLSRELGEWERAKAYYLEAGDFLEHTADTRSLGILYSNFGLLEQDTGHLEEAVVAFKKAIELHKTTGNEEGLAGTWGQLGRVFLRLRKDQQAETCFNYSSSHFISLGDPAGEAEALRGLASVYEARGDPELVRRCMARITEIQKRYSLP
jgi:tetratricopeptide (TPR) repeat protein